MDRKEFLLLAGGGFLVTSCEKSDEKPQTPASTPTPTAPGTSPVTTYLTADLTQELLTVGSNKQDAGKRAFVQRTAAGNTPSAFKHFSLTCTHAACLVSHQAANGEFHCPCHGSRFSADGMVLNGPAARPLEQYVLSIQGTTLLIKSS
ncbi:Rieske [2Fe-2S] domain protein [Hymenobacter roseosalivarius DSM 11622]|uniref:Rieske [2Fe-2S] domain protein n=1 Tax=Hymenobacter roseosalivarius DSM 11622 TaxID=645990 RepID=A0A1W1W4V9_9BACT|nr:ubiquinol-cytochrome c reductase iron-sulfur subunit [Hymenobacter roseosalivarius]SMC00553.1 Rieske [2Fe-2S] domain protein [Hymenobacter roseosalivarius DSM 11622]